MVHDRVTVMEIMGIFSKRVPAGDDGAMGESPWVCRHFQRLNRLLVHLERNNGKPGTQHALR